MARKKLVVPQEGTQPTSMPVPLDNMINDIKQASTPDKKPKKDLKAIIDSVLGGSSKSISNKRTCTFSIDKDTFSKFKAKCATNMESMSNVIENYMNKYTNN